MSDDNIEIDFNDMSIPARILFVFVLAILLIIAGVAYSVQCIGELPAWLFNWILSKAKGY